jgi:hypothetical protein
MLDKNFWSYIWEVAGYLCAPLVHVVLLAVWAIAGSVIFGRVRKR